MTTRDPKNHNVYGTISHGTMRMQDLIPAFLDAVRGIAPAEYEAYMAMPFGPAPAHALEDDDAEWWGSDDALYLFNDLMETLDQHAPDGYYFGTHPGDGSDFGYWPEEDWQEEDIEE